MREAVGAHRDRQFRQARVQRARARAPSSTHVLAGRLPKPGRMALTPMLTPKGKLYGDLTVSLPRRGPFPAVRVGRGAGNASPLVRAPSAGATASTYRNVLRRAARHRDLGPELARAACSGSRARTCRPTRLKFRDIRRTFVGGVPVDPRAHLVLRRARLTRSTASRNSSIALSEAIEAAGADLGLKLYGARALMSLRLEKNWGVWTLDYRPDFTAAESGLDAFIDWRRPISRQGRGSGRARARPARRLVIARGRYRPSATSSATRPCCRATAASAT